MAGLFGRVVVLRLTNSAGVGREFGDLRIDFDVKHTDASDPSSAKISIFNVSRAAAALASEEGAIVQLLVGYQGVPLKQIFAGNIVTGGMTETKQGPDRVLKLECADGGLEIRSASVGRSFATQTTLVQVVDELIAATGLARGTLDLPEVRWPYGVVLQGDARTLLTQYLSAAGRRWFVRDRAIQIVANGAGTGELAPVFSVGAGNLVGSPTRKEKGAIKVVALLGGDGQNLRPGKPFRVSGTERFDGDYLASEVSFRGGLWSNDFYLEAEGAPL